MVFIAYYTELNLQICHYAQKRRIGREESKYAPYESFYGHLPSPNRQCLLYRRTAGFGALILSCFLFFGCLPFFRGEIFNSSLPAFFCRGENSKTAYVRGLRYPWDPSLSRKPLPRFPHSMPPWSQPHNRRWCTFFEPVYFLAYKENAKFWLILTNLAYSVANLRTPQCTFCRPK